MSPPRRAGTASSRQADKRVAPQRGQGRPVDADGAETRRRIMRAAIICFGHYGYDRTTNQRIAARAGISAGTLYHYFESKAVIFRTVGDEIADEFEIRVRAGLDPELPTRQRLATIFARISEWIRERPEIAAFIATYATEVYQNDEVFRLSPAERWTRPMADYAAMAETGHARSDLAADVSPAAFGGLITGLVYGLCAFVAVSRDTQLSDEVMSAFVRLASGDLFPNP